MANITAEDNRLHEAGKQRAVKDATDLSPRLIFEAIRYNGEEELERPLRALLFSGLTAGILISFSVLGEATLRAYLPDVPWAFLVENAGYSLGFLLVILGRMQLFTENTITTVVPLLGDFCTKMLARVANLWGIVLASNVVGAFIVATFLAYAPVMSGEVREAFHHLSEHATGMPWYEGLFRGVPAGVLIAALVWMLPVAQNNQLGLIIIFTWLIAAGDFTHIIAGSVEMAYLVVQGDLSIPRATFGFFLPVLAGNVLGGTAVFTALAWGQIKPEVLEEEEEEEDLRRRAAEAGGAAVKTL